MKRQEGDASELCRGQEKPPLPLSELVDVLAQLKTGKFFFLLLLLSFPSFFFFSPTAPPPSITLLFFLLSSPLFLLAHWILLSVFPFLFSFFIFFS